MFLVIILSFIFSVRFTGVLFVQDEKDDDDVVGFLFGYQVLDDDNHDVKQ